MATKTQYITLHSGDTFSFNLEFDEAPTAFGCHFTAYKDHRAHSSSNILFSCQLDDGVTKVDDKTYAITVSSTKTKQTPGAYPYVFNVLVDDGIFTILDGVFEIIP